VQHLLQLVVLEGPIDPLLLVGVEQNALATELIITKLPDVGVAIRESPLSKVPEPVASVEASLDALQL
jgi:hypothetical protein